MIGGQMCSMAKHSSDNEVMVGLGVRSAEMEQAIDPPTPWDTVDLLIEVAPAPIAPPASPELRTPNAERRFTHGGAFTIPLICLGIGLIALCLLIPAAD